MRNIKKQTVMLLLAALCVTASALSVRAAQINIFHDFDEALAAASESGKPVMIDFYFDT